MRTPSNVVLPDTSYLDLFDQEFAEELSRIKASSSQIKRICLRTPRDAQELAYLAELQDCLDAVTPMTDKALAALVKPVTRALVRAVKAHPEWLSEVKIFSPALAAAQAEA